MEPNDHKHDYDDGRGGKLELMKLHMVVLPPEKAGQTVNLRNKADARGTVIEKVPDGARVLAGPYFMVGSVAWQQVAYNGVTGYTMAQYLMAVTDLPDPVPPDVVGVDKEALLAELEGLNKRQAVIIAALKGVK